MALTDHDFEQLGSLRGMRVFAKVIYDIVQDSSRDHDSFEDKIKEALDAQIQARDTVIIEKRIREAGLHDSTAALERFELLSDRGITQDCLDRLSTCEWIDYGQDLVICRGDGYGEKLSCPGGSDCCVSKEDVGALCAASSAC